MESKMNETFSDRGQADGPFADRSHIDGPFSDRPAADGVAGDHWGSTPGCDQGSMPRYTNQPGNEYQYRADGTNRYDYPYRNDYPRRAYPYEHDKTLTVVGLVLAFFIPLASIIIALLQLSELKQSNAVNKDTLVRMNTATLWINAVWLIVVFIGTLTLMSVG
jgi:hypothetical protein